MKNELFNSYLTELNTYPVLRKRRRFFDRFLVRFAGVSFLLLCVKFLAEWLIEILHKM